MSYDQNNNYNNTSSKLSPVRIVCIIIAVLIVIAGGIMIAMNAKNITDSSSSNSSNSSTESYAKEDRGLSSYGKSALDHSVKADVQNAAVMIEKYIVTTKGKNSPLSTVDGQGESTSIAGIKVSKDTTLSITGSAFHYVIKGSNPSGGTSADGIYYDSSDGGLQNGAVDEIVGKSVISIDDGTVTQTAP